MASGEQARLTLCMIVKDEEQHLGACLASVHGVVDEMLVVDTGSRDRTREIAKAYGARVLDHAWSDDFAAARNCALDQLSGGYVLVLDADERLAPGSGKALRKVVEAGWLDLGLLALHNAKELDAKPEDVVGGSARFGEPILVPRLLRWTPDLKYEDRVHENVGRWIREGSRRVEQVRAEIVHFGIVPSERVRRGKNNRNIGLLRKQCADHPDDGLSLARLSWELAQQGADGEALNYARGAFQVQLAAQRAGKTEGDPVLATTMSASLLMRAGQLSEARETLKTANQVGWSHPNLSLLQAQLLEANWRCNPADPAELKEAAEHLEGCLARSAELFSTPVIPGATSWLAAVRLGTLRLIQGELQEAAHSFVQALDTAPDNREAKLGICEAAIRCGQAGNAVPSLERLLDHPDPDAWILMSLAAQQLGSAGQAQDFAAAASHALRSGNWLAPHRRQWLQGQPSRATTSA